MEVVDRPVGTLSLARTGSGVRLPGRGALLYETKHGTHAAHTSTAHVDTALLTMVKSTIEKRSSSR